MDGDTPRDRALRNHRVRQRRQGFKRLELKVHGRDAALFRHIAAMLRSEGPEAERIRDLIRDAVQPRGRTLMDMIACDLPDDAFDEILARDRSLPRRVKL
jgi:hypothetical protein